MAQKVKTKVLGTYIKKIVQSAGLTQRDVSDKLGYSTPQFVSNWYRDVSKPPLEALKKIADMTNTSVKDLASKMMEQEQNELTAKYERYLR